MRFNIPRHWIEHGNYTRIPHTLCRECRVGLKFILISEYQLCANLRLQEQSKNMTSKYAFAWCYRSHYVILRCHNTKLDKSALGAKGQINYRWVSSSGTCVEHEIYYGDVMMGTKASLISSLLIVYSTVYWGADERKHQSAASLAFVRGIRRGRWITRTKGQ